MATINFIGCGQLGKPLASMIVQHALGEILGIVTTSVERAQRTAACLGAGVGYDSLAALPPADVYFIATQDDLIEAMCHQLIDEAHINPGSGIIHCSGSLSTQVLQRAKEKGCYTMSVHFLKNFADTSHPIDLKGVYCAFEGDKELVPLLNHLFGSLGAILFPIKKEQKKRYHIASVIASNYLVGLHYEATQCYKSAGFDEKQAIHMVSLLMESTLHNIQKSDHFRALSGPLRRGDVCLVKSHLLSLVDEPLLKAIYCVLGQAVLPITNHPDTFKALLNKIFEDD